MKGGAHTWHLQNLQWLVFFISLQNSPHVLYPKSPLRPDMQRSPFSASWRRRNGSAAGWNGGADAAAPDAAAARRRRESPPQGIDARCAIARLATEIAAALQTLGISCRDGAPPRRASPAPPRRPPAPRRRLLTPLRPLQTVQFERDAREPCERCATQATSAAPRTLGRRARARRRGRRAARERRAARGDDARALPGEPRAVQRPGAARLAAARARRRPRGHLRHLERGRRRRVVDRPPRPDCHE